MERASILFGVMERQIIIIMTYLFPPIELSNIFFKSQFISNIEYNVKYQKSYGW